MPQENSVVDLTPRHVRAARALLAWSQQDLAKAAGVATSTVADFERGRRTPVANNAQAIRAALEAADIRFLPTGAVVGSAGSGTASSAQSGVPVRWVGAAELSGWADRVDAAYSLPTLLAYLVRATHGAGILLRFPSDEGVRYSGWDGLTDTSSGSAYVPQGKTGWEIGSQRNKIAQKATDDYCKRTLKPAPLDPADAAYVFVTPRQWPQKDEWAKARQAEGVWREVRAYDASDLVHWIEQNPGVGLWLSARLNKRPPGTRELDDLWQEWSHATRWPLTEELVLTDRDEDAAEVLKWLQGAPSVLSLQATTTDEVAAFFHAVLGSLSDDVAATFRARCIVATTADSARALADTPAPLVLVLVLPEPEPGLSQLLARRGHHVLQACDDRQTNRGEVRVLAQPSREGIANALIAAGIAEPRAKALARDSARNLTVLRRLMPGAQGSLPRWAQEAPPRALLAALLAGAWDDAIEADKTKLAEIADQPYEAVVIALTPHVGEFDSPLQKIGSAWRISSPLDAWFLLARHLTGFDIARFETAALAVLGAADPRFDMLPDERWTAAALGSRQTYSGLLRHGIGQVLVLLAVWGEQIRTMTDAARHAEAIVEKLLRDADPQRWWSLSGDFRLLAEASPKAFLSAIEDSLDRSDPPIRSLFRAEGDGAFATEHLSGLLWALESLAWSPDLMPQVALVLARLDAIDNTPSRYANRPANSLREIHILWNPQTFASLDQRLRALDLIRKQQTEAAWKLMLGVLPHGRDSSTPSPMPRWRDFSVDAIEAVTRSLIERGAAQITKRLLTDVGLSAERWSSLLKQFSYLAPNQGAGLEALSFAEQNITDEGDRALIWAGLRSVLHRHRQFPEARRVMLSDVLDRLEVIYDRFAPSGRLERTAWLFDPSAVLPRPSKSGWEAKQLDIESARREAAHALFSDGGAPAILALARRVEGASHIGNALYASGLSESDLATLVQSALRSADDRERALAYGLIASAFGEKKEPWALALITRAQEEAWGDGALLGVLRALPFRRWTWKRVAEAGEEIEVAYWLGAPMLWSSDGADVAYAIRKFIDVGRARHALLLASEGDKVDLPSSLLIEVLQKAASQPVERDGDNNEGTISQHDVATILALLDERTDRDHAALFELEWTYLPLLEYSARPARVLIEGMSERPEMFIEVLSAVFNASEESGIVNVEPADPVQRHSLTTRAYQLLELWDRIPGTRADGTVDLDVLETWIKRARSLAKEAGREDVADHRIGHMLSASPFGADGNWPIEAVREVLDLFRSKPMIEGLFIGKSNRRGVTVRASRDGGNLERQESAKYRRWAKAMAFSHPHTAKALDALADSYEQEARHHDEDARRMDWAS